MAKATDEDWGKPDESGGLVSHLEVTVRKAKYGFLDSYFGGEQCLLQFTDIEIGEIDVPQEGDWVPFWSLGKGWEPSEGGRRAVHESRSTPHVSSSAGQVYKAIFGTKTDPAMEYEGVAVAKLLREHAGVESAMDAKMWEGTRWTFERHDLPESEDFRKTREAAGRNKPSALIPVEFGGFADEAKGKGKKKATSFDAEGFLAEVDPTIRKELRKAARTSDSIDEFGDLAGEIEGLGEDDELKATVLGNLAEIRDALRD